MRPFQTQEFMRYLILAGLQRFKTPKISMDRMFFQ